MSNLFIVQLWKVMRFTAFQLGLALLFAGLSHATDSAAQQALDSRVSLDCRAQSIKSVLRLLEKTANVQFLYSAQRIRAERKITVEARNERLGDLLDRVLKPLAIQYSITGQQIVLSVQERGAVLPNSDLNPEASPPSAPAFAVSGRVSDETGAAIPGATVRLKGSDNVGTTTNAEGRFSLNLPDGSGTLLVTSVGYVAQELAVGNQTTINFTLKADTKALEEVVVVGYGTVKKSDLTGSVAKVGEAAIKATPIASLDRAMQGRAAGVQVTSNSARPGGGATIRIRGSGSVNASNDPLYVIDGFPTGNLNSINTDDIESIEILKDASATAIYGSRGSNGVVLVTTKRGKTGRAVVSYDGYYGVQSVRRQIPLLNARQFADFVDEGRVNAGNKPYFDGTAADRPLPATLDEGTNWQDLVLREAPIQSHQLGVSGGTDKTRYAVSFGYYGQQGIVLNSDFKRYTLRANLDNDVTSRLKVGLTIQGAYTTGNNARTEVDGNGGGGVTSAALSYSPTFPAYNPDGSYYKNQGSLNGYTVDNPLAVANEIINPASLVRFLANSYLDYKIIDGLTFRASFGTDLQSSKSNRYTTRLAQAGASVGGGGSVGAAQSVNWLNENTLNFSRQLSPLHNVSALIGYTIQGLTTEDVTANANTFSDDFSLFNNLGAGSSLVAPSTGASDWRLISYLARVNYGFADRFLLTFTARRDGSSRFGPNNKFGFFPSGALAWKIINEKFLKTQRLVSDAKLRLSYGLSGNQEIGNYRYLANIASTPYVLGGALQSGARTEGIANPDLRWEKNAQFDAGLDLSFFNNRLQLSADYYIKTTSDLLFNVGVPTSSGFSTTLKNIGSVENRGFELSLSTVNVDKKGFRWTSDFNLTFNKNKILTLDGRQEFTTGTDAVIFATSVNPILLRVDSPLGNFFGRVTDGIFQNQAEVDASAQKTAKPGDLRYVDRNADGTINDLDRDVIGNANPDFFGGFNNTVEFKGLELNVFVQGSYGNEILNYGTFDLLNLTGGNNQSARALDRWTPTNPSNEIPRATLTGGARILSSFQVEDGSYLRFKNISLGYNLPKPLLGRLGLSGAKVYVAAQNFITLTKYTGYDPEVNRYGSSSLSQGLDYGAYPAAKTVLVGLNLKF